MSSSIGSLRRGRSSKKPDPPNYSRPGIPEFVTIIVEGQSFIIHKSLSSFHSLVFKTAFESTFIEGKTQTMNLPEAEASVFGLLVNWLYTQKVTNPGLEPEHIQLIDLGKLWMLARRCLIPQLQNAVIDMISDRLINLKAKPSSDLEQEFVTMLNWKAAFNVGQLDKLLSHIAYCYLHLLPGDSILDYINNIPAHMVRELCYMKVRGEEQGKAALMRKWIKSAHEYHEKIEIEAG